MKATLENCVSRLETVLETLKTLNGITAESVEIVEQSVDMIESAIELEALEPIQKDEDNIPFSIGSTDAVEPTPYIEQEMINEISTCIHHLETEVSDANIDGVEASTIAYIDVWGENTYTQKIQVLIESIREQKKIADTRIIEELPQTQTLSSDIVELVDRVFKHQNAFRNIDKMVEYMKNTSKWRRISKSYNRSEQKVLSTNIDAIYKTFVQETVSEKVAKTGLSVQQMETIDKILAKGFTQDKLKLFLLDGTTPTEVAKRTAQPMSDIQGLFIDIPRVLLYIQSRKA